nr:J domain-containing protein [Leptolyngbya sp. FACHB-321]
MLGLHPSASVREIRQSYRDLSKLYHPDTTALSAAIATAKFQQLNEAYATLSSPERRSAYDRKIGYSNVPVIQPSPAFAQPKVSARTVQSSSAYLDATNRPLSPGEIFALFILGLTFVGCLVLAITIGITRGEAVLQPSAVHPDILPQEIRTVETTNTGSQPPISQPSTKQLEKPVIDSALEPSSAKLGT